jgi:hypothetical protein
VSHRRAAWLLAAGRAAIGAAVLLAPEATMSRWLGADNARRGAVKALGRGLAVRDLGLAVATIQTLDDPVVGPRVQLACAFADGVDALATILEREELPPVAAAGTVVIAGGAALAGLYLSHQLAHAD